jgi:DNA-binding NtrC family response regulator
MELILNLTDLAVMTQTCPHDLCRILVVEDDALVREVSADILADAGFRTSEATCAAEALALLQNPEFAGEIDVIVTDVDMPGELDGFGLAARVHEGWPRIGVVITSGAPRGAALALRQPTLFLAKPFRADRLIAAVESVLLPHITETERRAS